jgi:WD40 repeat protein
MTMATAPENPLPRAADIALDFAPIAILTDVGEFQYLEQPFGFTPDGELLATVHREDTVKLWKIETGANAAEHAFGEQIKAVAFSADGIRVATQSAAGDVGAWDGASGASLNKLRPERDARLVILDPTGKRLALVDDRGELWLYAVENAAAPVHMTPEGGAERVVFSPDGARLATASGLGSQTATVQVWNADSGKLQGMREVSLGAGTLTLSLGNMAFNSGGDYLAVHSGYFTGSVKFSSGTVWGIAQDSSFGIGSTTTSLSVPGKNQLLSIDYEYRGTEIDPETCVRLWDLEAGKELLTRPCGGEPFRTAAISPDGRLLALASEDVVHVWDAANFDHVADLLHRSQIEAATFSSDSRRLAVRCADGIRVWQASTPGTQMA